MLFNISIINVALPSMCSYYKLFGNYVSVIHLGATCYISSLFLLIVAWILTRLRILGWLNKVWMLPRDFIQLVYLICKLGAHRSCVKQKVISQIFMDAEKRYKGLTIPHPACQKSKTGYHVSLMTGIFSRNSKIPPNKIASLNRRKAYKNRAFSFVTFIISIP